MGLFATGRTKEYTIIVGCGRLGANIADILSEALKKTLIIDRNKNAFKKLSPFYTGLVMVGDATEMAVLNEAHMEKATTVIAATNDDNTNILITQIAKEVFHIRHVLARLYDPELECVYSAFGIDTVRPRALSAKEVEALLKGPEMGKGAV